VRDPFQLVLVFLKKHLMTKEKWEIISENKQYFQYEGVSIYHVMEELNLPDYDTCNFVIDAGSISYVGPTALKYRAGRNFIFSPAQADMGCALPSALGVSSTSKNRTICVTGDGSFMSNMQELASFAHHSYNMTLIILNNSGYLSISNTQKNNYGANRMFGEHDGRGITFPNYEKLCAAFGMSFERVASVEELFKIKDQDINVVEIVCQSEETVAPYQTRVDGQQAGSHDMAPFRDKNELIALASTNLEFVR
jgi:thiamine pyrophosphate-dependent acetolactate synthase large subunit-like protein